MRFAMSNILRAAGVQQYWGWFNYVRLGAALLGRAGYTLGFATHF